MTSMISLTSAELQELHITRSTELELHKDSPLSRTRGWNSTIESENIWKVMMDMVTNSTLPEGLRAMVWQGAFMNSDDTSLPPTGCRLGMCLIWGSVQLYEQNP